MMFDDLSLIKAEDFRSYLNTVLNIRFEEGLTLPAELIGITELENINKLQRQPFSILFRTGQKDGFYSQAIYTIEHPLKGDLQIFLVPLGPDGRGMKYEAVFS
jgi:hypothetical protein